MVSLAAALAELANANTIQDVVNIASSLSAAGTGPGGAVLYGGNIGSAAAHDIAVKIAQVDNLNIIDNTVRAQFLSNPAVKAKLTAIYGALNPAATAAKIQELVTTELYGATTSSLWGKASADFVKSIRGAVTVVALTVKQGRILGGVELPAILANSGITSINKIPASGISKTVGALTSTIESSVTSALSKGGIFAAASTETTATAQFVSSQVLQAFGLPANGAESTAQYASQGLAESSAPALETAAAVDAENLLAAAGSKALGLLGGPLGLAVVDLLFGSKPLNQGEDLLVAQQQAAWLALDTPAADQNQQVTTDANGSTVVAVPLVSADGSVNDDFVLSVNPNSKATVLATATGNDSSLTVTSNLNGTQTIDDQIIDTLPSNAYKNQIVLNPDANGTIDITVTIEAGGVSEVSADQSLSGVVQDFVFAGSSGTLKVDSPSGFSGTISSFVMGDTLDLAGIGTPIGATLGAGNVLTVTESSGSTLTFQLNPAQNYSGEQPVVSPDGGGGADISLSKVGTTISTLVGHEVDITTANGNPVLVTQTGSVITGGNYAITDDLVSSPVLITNEGTLSAVTGINAKGSTTLVTNLGKVVGTSNSGVAFPPTSGTVVNGSVADTSASITGVFFGVSLVGQSFSQPDALTVINYGLISTPNSGTISGANDGIFYESPAGGLTVDNFGTINGKYGINIQEVPPAVSITNGSAANTTASIIGTTYGIWDRAGSISVRNYGRIVGADGILTGAGTINNSGTIVGTTGIVLSESSTVINSGTIESTQGTSGIAIQFGTGTNRLVMDPGSVIVGRVVGANGVLELGAASTRGSIGGVGTNMSNFATVAVDAGATWTLTGTNSISNLINNGTLAIASLGSVDVSSAVDPTSSGIFLLSAQSDLEIASCLGTNAKIQFIGGVGRLTIDNAADFGLHVGTASYGGPLLENFAASDAIDLKGIASAGLALNYATASGDLQITSNGKAVATLAFQNTTLGTGAFHSASDGAGGTWITHS